MMKAGILPTVALAVMAATSAQAKEDCDAPIRDWKGREAVRALAEERGWTLRRIKIDDGCYEVYGTDETGRRFEATVDPVTLDVIEIEEHHNHPRSYQSQRRPIDEAPQTSSCRRCRHRHPRRLCEPGPAA